jgi:uncharacterized protein (UPF0147 family)
METVKEEYIMKQLQKQLIENLKGYEFEELLKMLNDNEVPEIRKAIMDAMEKYHNEKFMKWLEEC